MRVLIVGEGGGPHPLAVALEAAGADVARPPESAFDGAPDDQVGELAAALVAFERLLVEEPPDAVLLVSTTNLALAAVLVAAKLRIPVAARVEAAPEDRASELNAPPDRAARRRHGRGRRRTDRRLAARPDRWLTVPKPPRRVHRATYTYAP